MSIFILDIDGTVADVDHRLHFLEQEYPDWDAFFNPVKVDKDDPIPEAKTFIEQIDLEIDDLMFLTGRPEKLRPTTEFWLYDNFNISPNEYILFMRPNGDIRPSVEVKEEILEDLLEGLEEPNIIFIDDERDNREMMSNYGEALSPEEAWELLNAHMD